MRCCPSRTLLQRFLSERLGAAEAEPLEAHLDACAPCQHALEELTNAVRLRADPAPASGTAFLQRLEAAPPPADSEGVLPTIAAAPQAVPAAVPPPTIPGYEVLRELGRGGMGIVYLARQRRLRRLVAMKMMLAGGAATAEQLARFRVEAEAAARLQHANIVQIYEVGEQAGQPYCALEYVDGGNLAQQLGGTPAPAAQAARLVETLARAMHYAHRQGVVHRDLKPANILLQRTENGEQRTHGLSVLCSPFSDLWTPKIADFGLAKRLDHTATQTGTGVVLGTPGYMAPEQAWGRNKDVGPAADVYALGAILFELLTGRPPFRGETPLDTLVQVCRSDPPAPRRLQPTVPRDLETICLKCLHKEPDARYGSAEDLADDLQRFLRHQPIRARPLGRAARLVRWARRNPALAAVTALALTTLLAAVAVSVWFAVYQVHAARRLDDSLNQVETQRQLAREQARKTALEASRLAVAQGIMRCERGDTAPGLLWLARGLEQLPASSERLGESIRRLLAGWSRELHPLQAALAHDRPVLAAAFSPDGKTILTGSWDNTARLWDATTGEPLGPVLRHDGPVMGVAFSPDGRTVLTGGWDKTARLWDAATGLPRGTPLPHPGEVLAVAFSPDGDTVLTGSLGGTAQLWSATTGQPLGPALPHDGPVRSVAFSPDGGLALTGSDDTHARLWDVTMRQMRGAPLPHPAKVAAVAFAPDGTALLTGCEDRAARLWGLNGQPLGAPWPGGGAVTAVAFSPDGKTIVTGGGDHRAQLWDAGTGQRWGARLEHGGGITTVAFSPDGRSILTGGYDCQVRCWKVTTGQPRALLPHAKTVAAVAFSPDGRHLVTGSWDSWVRRWDADTGAPLGKLIRHSRSVYAVTYSPDGRRLLTGSRDNTARLWDAATGKPAAIALTHAGPVNAVAFSPDGKVALTGSDDKSARLWDVATGLPCGLLLKHPGAVNAVAFGPDGHTIATAGKDRTVRRWDARTGAPLGLPLPHDDIVAAVAFAPDGKALLTGSWELLGRLWDAETATVLHAPLQHQGHVRAVAFSPDGRLVLTGSDDKTARLWDAATGLPCGAPLPHQHAVRAVAFSPDGKACATGSQDAFARIWPVPAPVTGAAEQVTIWVQVLTGMELDGTGTARWLAAPAWQERRERLQPQPTLPLP
jgi:WD40 repeat protein